MKTFDISINIVSVIITYHINYILQYNVMLIIGDYKNSYRRLYIPHYYNKNSNIHVLDIL